MFEYRHYKESADYISKKLNGFVPEVLLVLGSGLGYLGDEVENPIYVNYGDIPYFKVSTAPGHIGRFVIGILGGKKVIIMQGRMHLYEGYAPYEVAYPVRVARLLGAENMIVTNASGGINFNYKVGDLMLIKDYLKFSDCNILFGPNIPEFGDRFPDVSYLFTPKYRSLAKDVAKEQGLVLHEGVYTYFTGPQYESPTEIRAARILGGDVAGMSTIPECITAAHAGMGILGITLVTNMAAGVLDQPLTEEEVLESAMNAKMYFSKFVLSCLERM